MLNVASTNGQPSDSIIHNLPRSNGERKRLHKGHLSCLTVSTISLQYQTCTVTPLLGAGPGVGGKWAGKVGGGRTDTLWPLHGNTGVRNGTLHTVTYCRAEGVEEEMGWTVKRSPAVSNCVISCPARWTSLTLQGLYFLPDLSCLPLRWHFTSLYGEGWGHWGGGFMMGLNHWKDIGMGQRMFMLPWPESFFTLFVCVSFLCLSTNRHLRTHTHTQLDVKVPPSA